MLPFPCSLLMLLLSHLLLPPAPLFLLQSPPPQIAFFSSLTDPLALSGPAGTSFKSTCLNPFSTRLLLPVLTLVGTTVIFWANILTTLRCLTHLAAGGCFGIASPPLPMAPSTSALASYSTPSLFPIPLLTLLGPMSFHFLILRCVYSGPCHSPALLPTRLVAPLLSVSRFLSHPGLRLLTSAFLEAFFRLCFHRLLPPAPAGLAQLGLSVRHPSVATVPSLSLLLLLPLLPLPLLPLLLLLLLLLLLCVPAVCRLLSACLLLLLLLNCEVVRTLTALRCCTA